MKRRTATTIYSLGFVAAAVGLFGSAPGAAALCIYNGTLYAKTTLAQEFRDSDLVVRGEVVSSEEVHDPVLGVFYHVRVKQTFKGKPTAVLVDYSERDSGGFYLDVGTEFLLFLNPIDPRGGVEYLGQNWAKRAPGAMMVNYSCGQSRLWNEVPSKDRELLNALSTQSTKTLN
jgi:hypothetical protein